MICFVTLLNNSHGTTPHVGTELTKCIVVYNLKKLQIT